MTKDIQTHWQVIEPMLTILNEREYDQAVEHLNTLIDEIGTDEAHPLYRISRTVPLIINLDSLEVYINLSTPK